MMPQADAGPEHGMMSPILISVSVTPVSYFFCAVADAVAAAMIVAESARALASAFMKFVLKKSLSGAAPQQVAQDDPGSDHAVNERFARRSALAPAFRRHLPALVAAPGTFRVPA